MELSSLPVLTFSSDYGHDGAFIVTGFDIFILLLARWSFHRYRLYLFHPITCTMELSSLPVLAFSSDYGHDGAFIVTGFGIFIRLQARWSLHRYRFCHFHPITGTMELSSLPVLTLSSVYGHDGLSAFNRGSVLLL